MLQFALTMKAVGNAFGQRIASYDVNIPSKSYGILTLVYFMNGVSQQEIAEIAKNDKSAVLRHIDLLETQGLVERRGDASDRRKNLIVITDKGKILTKKIIDEEKKLFKTLSQGVSADELDVFTKVLQVLKTNAEKL
jgi:DNA-binding MarR family transcriptional regulator